MEPHLLVRNATATFLVVVPAIILWQMLTGRISLAGLLYERDPAGKLVYSPARLQLLVTSLIGVVQYLMDFTGDPATLPGVNPLVLTGVGGSQIVFLVSKAWAAYKATE